MLVYNDTRFGGIGTKSQTGCLIAWAGSTTLWRSGRQTSPALSTCEAEVAAAVLSWQIAEGIRSLLEEWGVKLHQPIVLVDNQSALKVAEFGGSWRTRYFATRAHRLGQEHAQGHISLRYCQTAAMMADGLTKLASAEVMTKLRNCMNGELPPTPGEETAMEGTDKCWWALMVLRPAEQHNSSEPPHNWSYPLPKGRDKGRQT